MNGRYIWANPVSISIGSQDVTALVNGGQWSNVDPGGYEACSLSLKAPITAPRAGERIVIRCGLEVIWDGRVNDPGNANQQNTQVEAIVGVGFGAALSDENMREIYVDPDLSRWKAPTTARKLANANLVNSGEQIGPQVSAGDTGAANLQMGLQPPWLTNVQVEAWYDALGIDVGSVYWAWASNSGTGEVNTSDSAYLGRIRIRPDDAGVGAAVGDSTDIFTGGGGTTGSNTVTASGSGTWVEVDLGYSAPFSADTAQRLLRWTSLTVFGAHGLTKRGAGAAQGYYPVDMALHALAKYNAQAGVLQIDQGQVDTDALAYVCTRAVYDDRQGHRHAQIIDDAMKMLGWHWGVWGPAGLHSTAPRLFLTKPPETATISVTRAECEDFDAPRVRLDQLYNYADVSYVDAGGRANLATVDIPNPLLDQAGIGAYRVLPVDAGLQTLASAQTYGTFALQLAQAAARGAGSATLPGWVAGVGGPRPACATRAGLDRIRIADLPDPGPLHEVDTRRFDTFRVKRVETTIAEAGRLDTRVEFDGGADLMEVLNARTAQALLNL